MTAGDRPAGAPEDRLPDPAVADFLASLAALGAAWRGDVREIAAWHAEQPGNSGWWDPWRPVGAGSIPVSSTNERITTT